MLQGVGVFLVACVQVFGDCVALCAACRAFLVWGLESDRPCVLAVPSPSFTAPSQGVLYACQSAYLLAQGSATSLCCACVVV
jgi:hypothetical protein